MTSQYRCCVVNDISPGNCELNPRTSLGKVELLGFIKLQTTTYTMMMRKEKEKKKKKKREFLERKTGDKTETSRISKMI